MSAQTHERPHPDASMILINGRIATQDERHSLTSAVAIKVGRFLAIGSDQKILAYRNASTQVIDLSGRTVIPDLNDLHTHQIRGGLNYNMELRWEGVPSLADTLRLLKEQAQRTPALQQVRAVGVWSEFQFAEWHMPTLGEINEGAGEGDSGCGG